MTAKRRPTTDPAPASLLVPEKLATLVHYLRHEKVILDSDLAELYGVPTKVLNQAVQRNLGRFPPDFMFQLTDVEFANLKSQFVTSKNAETNLRSQNAIAKNAESLSRSQTVTLKRGGRRTRPYAFTEQGNEMLSSVLRKQSSFQHLRISVFQLLPQVLGFHTIPSARSTKKSPKA
jgi:hypothetical protein